MPTALEFEALLALTHGSFHFFDFVNFADSFDSNQKIGAFGDTITFSDGVIPHLHLDSFEDTIQYQDRMSLNIFVVETISDTLAFSDQIFNKRGDFGDLLQLFDSLVNDHAMKDTLIFSDSFTTTYSHALYDALTLTDTITFDATLNRTLTDTLSFVVATSIVKFRSCAPVFPILVPEDHVIFTSTINNMTVTLPAPKFGDSETINFKRINKTTRGDDIIIEGEPNWHPTFLHKLEWDYLSEDQCTILRGFLRVHVAIPVNVHTHYGQTWKIVFLRPDVEFSQVGRENRTVTLDMQIVQ